MSNNSTLDRLHQLLPQLFQPVQVSGVPYLRLQLTTEIPALIQMSWVQEALLVKSSAVSPLPNLPDFSIGMMSTRDRVFLMVDLGQILGLPALSNPSNYQTVVIRLPKNDVEHQADSEKYLGLVVSRVGGVARFDTEPVPLTDEFSHSLKPYLLGGLMERDQQISVLNIVAIVANIITRSTNQN